MGRSGFLVHTGFNRVWKKNWTDVERANDVVISGWDQVPLPHDMENFQAIRAKGCSVMRYWIDFVIILENLKTLK